MGRKSKKPFIDKKKAHSYFLVARSQKDPLASDARESQNVLKPQLSEELVVDEIREIERKEEQQSFGVFFEDDYDYLQHLRPPGTSVLEAASLRSDEKKDDEENALEKRVQFDLPEELFGSEVVVHGNLDKVVPTSGPRPDWDPEIVEALEKAEVSSEMDLEGLEDDFVVLANAGDPGLPVFITEHCENDDHDGGDAWWQKRGDFEYSGSPNSRPVPGAGDEADNELASGSSRGDDSIEGSSASDMSGDLLERRTARFTEYSMSSSVVPRSEALTLLDDRFEEFMAGYSEDQLGAGEMEDEGDMREGACPDPRRVEYDQMLIQNAMDDFKKRYQENNGEDSGDDSDTETQESDEGGGRKEEVEESMDETGSSDDSGNLSEDEEECVLLERYDVPKKERWDCESILSTNSTLYNHPTKICEPRSKPLNPDKIKLSNKTGMPLGVIPGPLPKENHPKKGTITRPRNEDQDEKKARKLAMKEERKQRRADKKATKMVFKAEALKQEKLHLNNLTRRAPVV